MNKIFTVSCRSAISKSTLPGLEYTFNPYVGCQHGCLYCYVPDVLRKPAVSSRGESVHVKKNIVELLKSDLKKNHPGVVGVSTVTDPYQPVEKVLEITRQSIAILAKNRFPVSVQTKSSLVTRDLDIIKGELFDVGITITSLENEFYRLFEPGASSPQERAQALEEVSSKVKNTWIFYGPIIPNFNNSMQDIVGIVRQAKKTNSKIIYDRLNIRPLMSKRLKKIFSPSQIETMRYYDWHKTFHMIEKVCIEQGVRCEPAF